MRVHTHAHHYMSHVLQPCSPGPCSPTTPAVPSQRLSPKIPPITHGRSQEGDPMPVGTALPWPGPGISCDSRGSAGTGPTACPPGPVPVQAVPRQDTGWGLSAPKPGRGGGKQRVQTAAEPTVPDALAGSTVRAKAEPAAVVFARPGQQSQAAAQQALCFALDRHSPAAARQRTAWPTFPPP